MSPSFVKDTEGKGTKTGVILASLKENIDRPLAGILSLNTIAHTVGAAGVGAQAASVFGEGYFGVISAVLTLLILFFSEIIPKTLGALYWKQLAAFTAYTCKFIIVALYPLVLISERLTKLLSPRGPHEGQISRDEVVAMAQLGHSEGVIAERESKIIRNLIRFRRIQVDDIMTPRTVVSKLPESMACGEAVKQDSLSRFSRIPVHSEDAEHITGYVLKQKVLEQVAFDKHDTLLSDIKRPIRLIHEDESLSNLFNSLFSHKEHMALVVDEYGGMSGLVTSEDLIETLLGLEITDESDETEDMRDLARKRWEERARKLGIVVPELQKEPEAEPDA